LYFRRWQKGASDEMEIVASGELAATANPDEAVDAFTMADQLKFYVQEHIPGDKPAMVTLPLEFQKDKNVGIRRPAAEVRLTVDGKSETFWLAVYKGDPDFTPTGDSLTHTVAGKNRSVSITLPMRAVDIGFRVQLENFERRLDPGTSQPSHYSSTVRFLERNADRDIRHAALDGSDLTHFALPDLPYKANEYFTASSIALTGDGEWLYWVDGQRRIQRISREERDAKPETVVGSRPSPATPAAIAIDNKHEQLYWVEYLPTRSGNGLVRRADLDGENATTVATFAGWPTGVAIDEQAEIVFWSYRIPSRAGEQEAGAIGRVDFSGENLAPNLVAQMGVPSSIAINPDEEHIYWTEPARGALRRADYDGANMRRISLDGEQRPTSVAVDAENERMYWADAENPPPRADEEKAVERLEHHRIWTADLGGDDSRVLAGERIFAPNSLLIDRQGRRLWWTQDAVLRDDVWITMNAPVEFANPRTGQSYRLFQESFVGPFKPGSTEYEELVPNSVNVPELYASVLTVNYDPGRWIRNIGCLLIVCGIATMFYMRAYFFRPVRRVETTVGAERQQLPAPATTPAALEKSSKKQAPAKVMT
jgi:sugar lactone lactonase YvrE